MKPADGPFFSVIIPTYNRAALLPRAVASVQAQSYPHWELIIVDDGSTDHTRTLAEAYARQDGRVRYVWQENKQLNAARNRGVDLARGQYVCFLDDDDEFLPIHLEQMAKEVHSLNLDDIALLKTQMLVEYKGVVRTGTSYDSQAHPIAAFWHDMPNLLSFAFNRRIFDVFRFDERFLLFDDAHFLLRVLTRFPLFYIHHPSVLYHIHSGARSLQYTHPSMLQNHLQAIDHLFVEVGNEMIPYIDIRAQHILQAKTCYHFSRAAAKQQQFRLALSYLALGIRIYFSLRQTLVTCLFILKYSFTSRLDS